MKMCKYCGGIVKIGFGKYGVYCSKECCKAVEGFDEKLRDERRDKETGAVSVEKFMARGGDISDGGTAMEDLYDRLDGTEPDYNPKMDLGEVMRTAAAVHPLLPSALVLLAQGKTLREAAKELEIDFSNLNKYHKALLCKYK